MSRILYVNHDNPNPSGGVQVIYAHVEMLRSAGFPAYVVHNRPDFAPSWFRPNVPVLYFQGDLKISGDDIVVLPEDHPAALEAFREVAVRKILFCQNHFYVFVGLGARTTFGDYGISEVLACSNVIAEFIRTELGCHAVSVVPNSIDARLFQPGGKKLQIACMPRKRIFEASFIRGLFERLTKGHVPWVSIENRTQGETAALLGESAIFLSLSHYEGFGLPPLEAMASGCLVAGFRGWGGAEYATRDNGLWCTEGDVVDAAHTLVRAVERVQAGGEELANLLRSSAATAAEYSVARQRERLIEVWSGWHPRSGH